MKFAICHPDNTVEEVDDRGGLRGGLEFYLVDWLQHYPDAIVMKLGEVAGEK